MRLFGGMDRVRLVEFRIPAEGSRTGVIEKQRASDSRAWFPPESLGQVIVVEEDSTAEYPAPLPLAGQI